MKSRIEAIILGCLLLSPLAGCGGDTEKDDTEADEDTVLCDKSGAEESDIAFFVDQSASMAPYITSLQGSMSSFWGPLDTSASSYQLITVPSANGCDTSGRIENGDKDRDTRFAQGVSLKAGWSGNGLEVAQDALDQVGPGECNDAFVRTQSFMHLIFVSDILDSSPETWDSYLVGIRSEKLDLACLKMSVLGVDQPGSYQEIASASGGLFLDITGDMSSNLASLGALSVGAALR